MSFITRMLALADGSYTTTDYAGLSAYVGGRSIAGENVSAESALKLSAWWACDRLLCETVASLPALVFERLADGGRRRATNHPLYDVLHRQPNDYQTAIEFFDFVTHSAAVTGNGFAGIVAGPRGFADQLRPYHPDYVQMERLSNNRLRYRVMEPGRPVVVLSDSEMLHLKGMSSNGVTGAAMAAYAHDSLGLGLAAERYGARFFRNNAEPRGVLKSAKALSPDAGKRLKASWNEAHSGENQSRVAVLEEGLDYQAISLSNKDSQFLESREFQAEDICRWWRTPPHMVGLTSKATSWGSGIEQMGIGYITYTLMPWLVRWQQAISRDLILAPDKYFVEFVTEALLRGDTKGRYDAYAVGVQNGWLSPNDVRQTENMNARPGGDVYVTPAAKTMTTAPAQASASGGDHYAHLVNLAAARVVRKEVAALTKVAKRGGDWAQAVNEFYADHADFVAQTLGIAPDAAQAYVSMAVEAVTAAGPDGLTGAEGARAAELAALVMEAV